MKRKPLENRNIEVNNRREQEINLENLPKGTPKILLFYNLQHSGCYLNTGV